MLTPEQRTDLINAMYDRAVSELKNHDFHPIGDALTIAGMLLCIDTTEGLRGEADALRERVAARQREFYSRMQ